MKRLVVLSGAGISADSGLKTFRDAGGLWEGHRVEDVATPEAFARNPAMVMSFYNMRRAQLKTAQPNEAHRLLAELERHFEVQIITQNVDNFHERAGSTQVLHLHGQLNAVRPVDREPMSADDPHIQSWEDDLHVGDVDDRGVQLRPHIVWFGEAVPMMEQAAAWASRADMFLVIGTSMTVYPAASLVHFIPDHCELYVIDKGLENHFTTADNFYQMSASEGMRQLSARLLAKP